MSALNTNLKLRLGYGEVGNQAIANYLYGASLLAINSPFGTVLTAWRKFPIPS